MADTKERQLHDLCMLQTIVNRMYATSDDGAREMFYLSALSRLVALYEDLGGVTV